MIGFQTITVWVWLKASTNVHGRRRSRWSCRMTVMFSGGCPKLDGGAVTAPIRRNHFTSCLFDSYWEHFPKKKKNLNHEICDVFLQFPRMPFIPAHLTAFEPPHPQKSQSEVSLSCVVVGGRSKDEDLVWFLFSWEEPEMFIMFNVCGLKSGQTFEAVFNQIRLATL